MSELVINSEAHDAALMRFMTTSRKSAVEVAREEFGLLLENVAKYTPPASAGVTGRAAERQGMAAVEADIRSIYGTPGDAYEALEARSPASASAFWFLHSQGLNDGAARIVRENLGKSFSRFDGGQAHRVAGGGKRRLAKIRREKMYYVRNGQSLESYIAQEQSHVWWLASGWAPALRALGRKLPYGVGKLNTPGNLTAMVNERAIVITAIDRAKFASDVSGIRRRILWAMDLRVERMQRRWDFYLAQLARENGMRVR